MVIVDDKSDMNWIETDEAEDVCGSVRHALRCAQFVREDPQAYKWLLLALHSALQGACVCHLVTSAAPVGAVTEKNAGEWLKYFEKRRTNADAKAPKTKLMDVPSLLKAVRKKTDPHRHSSQPIEISDKDLSLLVRFHEDLRNQFTHFEPLVWLIEVSGVRVIAALIARIVTDILDRGWAFRHLDEREQANLRSDLSELAALSI